MYSEELENMIEGAIQGGELSEKKREILIRKAEEEGINADEFEMVLDSRLHKAKAEAEATNQAVAAGHAGGGGASVKRCPMCGTVLSPTDTKCPNCDHLLSGGRPMGGAASTSPYGAFQPKEDKKNYILYGALGVAVLVILVMGFKLMQKDSEPTDTYETNTVEMETVEPEETEVESVIDTTVTDDADTVEAEAEEKASESTPTGSSSSSSSYEDTDDDDYDSYDDSYEDSSDDYNDDSNDDYSYEDEDEDDDDNSSWDEEDKENYRVVKEKAKEKYQKVKEKTKEKYKDVRKQALRKMRDLFD